MKCKDCGAKLHDNNAKRCMSCASKAVWTNPERKARLARAVKANWRAGVYTPASSYHERLVMDILDDLGIEYISQFHLDAYHYDLMLPGYNQIIEVDGPMHRQGKEIKRKDVERDALANQHGFDVWRITNKEAESTEFAKLLESELCG